ncbi:hypothetical protein NUW58_g2903 [Xylaria curta]|uniref:Uncharacterized protein n=1 Tax=Xylaria curta TaxID=42375 RepID=A0ACC1PDE6_9PEZI|nr:hypothetical protein NUW58_g2903 [Xylaria curta]
MMVVQPLLNSPDSLTVAGNFHHGLQYKEKAGCMLSSDRMRSIFNRAVIRRDLQYLTDKVNERINKKDEFDARLKALQRQNLGLPRTEAETERLVKEWKRYE